MWGEYVHHPVSSNISFSSRFVWYVWRTCVWDETLQVGSGSLVLQQFLRGQVSEEHLEDGLGVLTIPGVGVPHHTVTKERLWAQRFNRIQTLSTYKQIRFKVLVASLFWKDVLTCYLSDRPAVSAPSSPAARGFSHSDESLKATRRQI